MVGIRVDLVNHHTEVAYSIKYRLHNKLGPVKMPNQKMRLPRVFCPLSHLVRLSLTSCANGT